MNYKAANYNLTLALIVAISHAFGLDIANSRKPACRRQVASKKHISTILN